MILVGGNMKTVVQNDKLGEVTYEESFWTGKKNIKVNSEYLTKVSKKCF